MLNFTKWKITLIAVFCVLGIAFALPNFLDRQITEELPSWLPHQQVNLGLDLQGGSHLLLEVDVDAVIAERLESLVDSIRSTLRKEKIGYRGLGTTEKGLGFTLTDPARGTEVSTIINDLESGLDIERGGDKAFRVSYAPKTLREIETSTMSQSIEIVRRRIDETGTREPTIQRQGTDRILIQLPGVKNPEHIKNLLGRTAKLTLHLLDKKAPAMIKDNKAPVGAMIVPSGDPSSVEPFFVVRKRVMVSGNRLKDAQASYDSTAGRWIVNFKFDSVGSKKFGKVTTGNVSKRLAIILDGKVVSAPVIREPILGGSGQISGSFTAQQVNDLALLLRAGALPAPLTILEERSVGPSLGVDSIAAGKIACIIGLAAVVIFMVLGYGLFGVMADVALGINLAMIFGALSLLQATLTLPGIAGIVLTVGMAVDANVLIFEHIREEVWRERTPFNAIEAGYKRALTTIIDANVTTLIAALFLFEFGSGPIKGFAVTLSIGIVTSMFTAIMVTRLMVVAWLRRCRPQTLPV
ncbi:MAG: protein translocase subunit SecD [Alphaproteobacteria bacterium]|jgi:preprotein translocase subunit SecD|nr:protein translocase subunit SecD [Alphaproteobacteria bacterium]